ncbi:hypothetical protein IJF86_00680 [Candidatus Saccharibacteria bacterium]|nr:hypothetical protein [Candidatus Saccharibacteria bacterium]
MPKKEDTNRKPETFTWKTGTIFEKISFVFAAVFLVAAIVFLVFEFVSPSESWPYIWFDTTVGLSFLGDSLTHWRFNRRLAIITLVCAAIFILTGMLKLFGVIAA